MNNSKNDYGFKEIVRDVLNPEFKKMKYSKSSQNYFKKENDLCLTFNYQTMELNNSLEFTFNLGVCYPKIYEFCSETCFPIIPKPWYAIDYIRVGNLIDGRDYWYSLNGNTDIILVKELVKTHLHEYVFPYLNQFHNDEDIINILRDKRNQGDLQFITILYMNGYENIALKKLEDMYKMCVDRKNDLWIGKIKLITAKLGITLEIDKK